MLKKIIITMTLMMFLLNMISFVSYASSNRSIFPTVFSNLKANDPTTPYSTGSEAELNRGKYVPTNHKVVLFEFDLGDYDDYQSSQVYLQFTSRELASNYDFGYYVYAIPKIVVWDEEFTYNKAMSSNKVIGFYEKTINEEPSMVYQMGGTAKQTTHKIDVTRIVRDSEINGNGKITIMIEALSDLKATESVPANIYTQFANDEDVRPKLIVDNDGAPKIYQNLVSITPALDTNFYYAPSIPERANATYDTVKYMALSSNPSYFRVAFVKFNLKNLESAITDSNLIEFEFFESGGDQTFNGGTLNAKADLMYYITALTKDDINKIAGTSFNSMMNAGYINTTDAGKFPKNPIVVAKRPAVIYSGKDGTMYTTKRKIDITEYVKNKDNYATNSDGDVFVMLRIDLCSPQYGTTSFIRTTEFGGGYAPKLSFAKVTGRETTDNVPKTTKTLYANKSAITRSQWPTAPYPVTGANIQFKNDKVTPDIRSGFIEFPIGALKEDIENADDIRIEISSAYKSAELYAGRNMNFDIFSIPKDNIPVNGLVGLTHNVANSIGMLSKSFNKLNVSPFTAYTNWANANNPYNIYEQKFQIDVTSEVKAKIENGEDKFIIRMDDLMDFSGATVVDIYSQNNADINRRPKLTVSIPQYEPIEPPITPLDIRVDSNSDTYVDQLMPNSSYGVENRMIADGTKTALLSFPVNKLSPQALGNMTTPTIAIRTANAKNGIGKLYKLNNVSFTESDTYNSLNNSGALNLDSATLVTTFNIKEGAESYELDLSSIINELRSCDDTMSFVITSDNYAEFYPRQSLNRPTLIVNSFTDQEEVYFASQNLKLLTTNVNADLLLPHSMYNVGISWTSSEPQILDAQGGKAVLISIPDETQDVILMAEFTKVGNTPITNTYAVNVLGKDYYAELLKQQYDALDIANKLVTTNFTLPGSTNDLVDISWSSNNSAIGINKYNAVVTRGEQDVNVSLKAQISIKGNYIIDILEKSFDVRVAKSVSSPKVGDIGGVGNGGNLPAPTPTTPNITIPVVDNNNVGSDKNLAFTDVSKGYWAYPYIIKLSGEGIIYGVGDRKFEPDRSITREEFTKILVVSFKINPINDNPLPFSEIASDFWAKNYIRAAYDTKIINGLPDSTFGIGQNITRQDLATMVYRALIYKGIKIDKAKTNPFVDDGEITDYAKDAVYALKNAGILKGNNNNYRPTDFATRAEVSKVICQIVDLIN